MNHEIRITDKPDGEDVQRVLSGLRVYNYSHFNPWTFISDWDSRSLVRSRITPKAAGDTSFRSDLELLFSCPARCHTKQCLRRVIKLEEDMKNITKALIGIAILAF
ncbi:MAG: hypothetical protein O7C72_04655 [Deltaproteobacteria bacterium]|nr:hypothetical protein [Deltaproteobacteria bacterium]